MTTNAELTRISADDFTAAMGNLPGPVTALTTLDPNGEPIGATLSAVTSLSLDPPMVLASLGRTSDTLRGLRVGVPFALHILRKGQEGVAARLAGKGTDKFYGIEWQPGAYGVPEITGSATILACETEALLPGGDHVIVLGAVRRVELRDDGEPLVYHRRGIHVIARGGEAG